MAKQSTTTESTTTRRANRTNEEWDKLALEVIVPRLQAGDTMTAIRADFGAGVTIRKALSRVGYNTKGQQVTIGKTAGSNAKVLAKRVAERRQQGAAWWRLAMETGKDMDELKAILTKHGYESVVNGRVIVSERGKRKLAKAEAEAAAAASRKATRKPRSRKAKVVSE
jgi:hypothetical protein